MKTRGGPELVEVEVILVHETERAWLVSDDEKREVWVPKSCGELTRRAGGRWMVLLVERPFAEKSRLV